MVWLSGLKEKLGSALSNLRLLKFTFCCAVSAVSLVSNGSCPFTQPLMASNLQTSAANQGVTLRVGGFLPNPSAIAVNKSLYPQFSADTINRSPEIVLSINSTIAFATS